MNAHQAMARDRRGRRFSRGDAVTITSGPDAGTEVEICSISIEDGHPRYAVEIAGRYVVVKETQVTSRPAVHPETPASMAARRAAAARGDMSAQAAIARGKSSDLEEPFP